ncbi:serine hydrolase domain-containing protein [Pirellulaceae bacterium SH467]
MNRRVFLSQSIAAASVGATMSSSTTSSSALSSSVFGSELSWQKIVEPLRDAVARGQVRSAAFYGRFGGAVYGESFGDAKDQHASFLLGSISKPIAIAAVMSFYDEGAIQLSDPVSKFLPEFRGDGREAVTIQHLLTHVSGLPDQVPENAELRRGQAPLGRFVAAALQLKPAFKPGTAYEYSSMGILLACEIAQRLSGITIDRLVNDKVTKPLGMSDSSLGVSGLSSEQLVSVQTEFGAPEAGGGSAESKSWDWNSPFWRQLGAPWGGMHSSATDVGKFLETFLRHDGKILKPETSRLMVQNFNPKGLPTRGLGLDVGFEELKLTGLERAFGHTGSTGTIGWADPAHDRVCVVLTSLPARALEVHPRLLVTERFCGLAQNN